MSSQDHGELVFQEKTKMNDNPTKNKHSIETEKRNIKCSTQPQDFNNQLTHMKWSPKVNLGAPNSAKTCPLENLYNISWKNVHKSNYNELYII